MKKLNKLEGFDVEYCDDKKNVVIKNYPHFPQKTSSSKKLYQNIEKINFEEKEIMFPIKLIITERLVDIENNKIDFFTIEDLFNLIVRDKNRFINTKTFFKVELDYKNENTSQLSIYYYTIQEEGETIIKNIENLLDFVFVEYDMVKFTKKFIEPRKKKYGNSIIDIEYIPLLPLLWLDYDENNNLIYFNHFKLIENDPNYRK
jgi:hypothetical protein